MAEHMKAHCLWQNVVDNKQVQILRTSDDYCVIKYYSNKSNKWIVADAEFSLTVYNVAFLATHCKLRDLANEATDFLNSVE